MVQKYSGGDRQASERVLRSEVNEHQIEKIDREVELGGRLLQFKKLMDQCSGGRYIQDYQALLDGMSADALSDSDLWHDVFADERLAFKIETTFLFSFLPVQAQTDQSVYKVFADQPDFSLLNLSRSVAERINQDDVVAAWQKADFDYRQPIHIDNIPWDSLSEIDSRRIIDRIVKAGHAGLLDKQKSYFINRAISAEEWSQILRAYYQGSCEIVMQEIAKNGTDYFDSIFSSDELRVLLRGNYERHSSKGRQFYLDLPLPALRKLGFDEEEVDQWKRQYEVGIPQAHRLDHGSDWYEKMSPEDRKWFSRTLSERRSLFGGKYASFIEKDLPKIVGGMQAGTVPKTLQELSYFFGYGHELPEKEIIDGFVMPLIASQGPSVFRALEIMRWYVDTPQGEEVVFTLLFEDPESLRVLRSVMSKTGSRFQDFLNFYLSLRLDIQDLYDRKISHSTHRMAEDGRVVEPFLDAKLPWTVDVYQKFDSAIRSGGNPEEVARAIAEEVRGDVDAIIDGEWPEGGLDDYRAGLLTHVFPPAMGVSRNEYVRLTQRRNDRQKDVPYEFEALQGKEVTFALGKWELKKEQVFETVPWESVTNIVGRINKKRILSTGKEDAETIVIIPERVVEIGRAMVAMLEGGDRVSAHRALEDAYVLFLLNGGAKLPDVVSDREGGSRLYEWLQEAMRDTIDLALRRYREANPERFEREVKAMTAKGIPDKAKKGIARQVIGVMGSLALDAETTNARIKDILGRAGVDYEGDMLEALTPILEGIEDRRAQERAIESVISKMLEDASSGMQAGKISSVVVSKILGADGDGMRRELDKWQFTEGAEGGETSRVTFAISKKKLHAVAGLNMGVCVAVDEKLWNKPEFMNVIMFGDNGIARGGMHYEIVQDGRDKFLSLPGINPSMAMLREARPEKVLQEMLEFAKASARAIGAKAILIPTNSVIFSNREELHGLIKAMQLPLMNLQKFHRFSYSPFSYEWKEAYVLRI